MPLYTLYLPPTKRNQGVLISGAKKFAVSSSVQHETGTFPSRESALVSYQLMMETFKDLFAEGYRARRENRLPASRAIFIDGVRRAAEDGDRASLAEALSGLAQAENDIGNCAAARHHYANAALLYRQDGPPTLLASAIRHEADLLVQMKLPSEAEPLYLDAERIYRQSGKDSDLDLAHTLRGIALMKEATGDHEASKSAWQEARQIYASHNDKQAVTECDGRLSSAHLL